MKPQNFSIDPEFSSALFSLSNIEFETLEESILKSNGPRDPLIVWNGLLLDGHNRLKICNKHNLSYQEKSIILPDREAALDWIDKNQLGRRNLSPDQTSFLRGRIYNRTKKAKGFQSAGPGRGKTLDRNDPMFTADKLAEKHGVSAPTIKRDGEFAKAVEKLGLEKEIARNKVTATKAEVIKAAKKTDTEKIDDIRERLVAEKKTRPVNVFTGEIEWYTPSKYIESCRTVLGSIDCDPASSEFAQKTVKAKQYFTQNNNGLDQVWKGRIFLNPPYSAQLIKKFTEHLLSELKSGNIITAILLTNNNTDTSWWHDVADAAGAVCFTRGRISFYNQKGEFSSPTNGQTFFYFGNDIVNFKKEFSQYGLVVML